VIATATLSRPPLPTADAISKESHKLGTPHVDRRVEITRSTRRPTFARRPLDVCSTVPRRGSDGQPKAAVLPRATLETPVAQSETAPPVRPFPATGNPLPRPTQGLGGALGHLLGCHLVGPLVLTWSPLGCRSGSLSQQCYPKEPRARTIDTEATSPPETNTPDS